MFNKKTSGYTPKSTSKDAKKIIRSEMRKYYSPSNRGGGRSTLENMKSDAEASVKNYKSRYPYSDYSKGTRLVDSGCFAISHADQREMLGKIYGKKKVESWSGDKLHNTYKHLIGREYDSMLREQANKKPTKKPAKKSKRK